MAAVETLRHGFKRFLVDGLQSQNTVQAVQMPYAGANATGT